MRLELVLLAFVTGGATWAFRFVPTKFRFAETDKPGFVRRFLVATGPAAIATLFVASVLPIVTLDRSALVPLALGTVAVLAVYLMRPSVVLATLAGAVVFGLATLLPV